MTYQDKVKSKIKELARYDHDEIVSLGNPFDYGDKWVHRNGISLTKLLNLLESGWIAIPF
jgi:hypothetical protein